MRSAPRRARAPSQRMQVHPAAMHADLGERIPREPAARLGVDELAEAVEEAALAVLDALARQRLGEAERGHLAHGMGQQGDADAQLLHLGRALVHPAGDPALVQREREGQPADAAADDGDVHALGRFPRHPASSEPHGRCRRRPDHYSRFRSSSIFRSRSRPARSRSRAGSAVSFWISSALFALRSASRSRIPAGDRGVVDASRLCDRHLLLVDERALDDASLPAAGR